MKYFKLIRSDIDVAALLEEVRSQEDAWLINTGRQDKIRSPAGYEHNFPQHRRSPARSEHQRKPGDPLHRGIEEVSTGSGLHDRVRPGNELSSVARHHRAP